MLAFPLAPAPTLRASGNRVQHASVATRTTREREGDVITPPYLRLPVLRVGSLRRAVVRERGRSRDVCDGACVRVGAPLPGSGSGRSWQGRTMSAENKSCGSVGSIGRMENPRISRRLGDCQSTTPFLVTKCFCGVSTHLHTTLASAPLPNPPFHIYVKLRTPRRGNAQMTSTLCVRCRFLALRSPAARRAAPPFATTAVNATAAKTFARGLATAAPDPPAARKDDPLTKPRARAAGSFSERLDAGPSFGDFVGGRPEEPLGREDALELRTAVVGPEGRKKTITRLPEWLKTPVPVGDNYKKIKADLRGLNLHTGEFISGAIFTQSPFPFYAGQLAAASTGG